MSRTPVREADTAESPVHQGPAATKERRIVFSGEAGGGQSEFMTRGNKPLKRRRKSPFKIVSLIAAISFLIVFYVWNKITVNRLADEIDALNLKKQTVTGSIEKIRAEIDRKSNGENIEKLASTKLRMISNPERPVFFEVENYEPAAKESRR